MVKAFFIAAFMGIGAYLLPQAWRISFSEVAMMACEIKGFSIPEEAAIAQSIRPVLKQIETRVTMSFLVIGIKPRK